MRIVSSILALASVLLFLANATEYTLPMWPGKGWPIRPSAVGLVTAGGGKRIAIVGKGRGVLWPSVAWQRLAERRGSRGIGHIPQPDAPVGLWYVTDSGAPRPLGQPLPGHMGKVYSVAF